MLGRATSKKTIKELAVQDKTQPLNTKDNIPSALGLKALLRTTSDSLALGAESIRYDYLVLRNPPIIEGQDKTGNGRI